MDSDSTDKKLLWRCRRGTRELDEILGGFVTAYYNELTLHEKGLFDTLLEVEDPKLSEWLCLDIQPTDQGMVEIVNKILSTRYP